MLEKKYKVDFGLLNALIPEPKYDSLCPKKRQGLMQFYAANYRSAKRSGLPHYRDFWWERLQKLKSYVTTKGEEI